MSEIIKLWPSFTLANRRDLFTFRKKAKGIIWCPYDAAKVYSEILDSAKEFIFLDFPKIVPQSFIDEVAQGYFNVETAKAILVWNHKDKIFEIVLSKLSNLPVGTKTQFDELLNLVQ